MEEQGSKYRSTISMLNKIFDKYFDVCKVFADLADDFANFFHCLEPGLYM